MSDILRVLVADDHRLMVEGIRRALRLVAGRRGLAEGNIEAQVRRSGDEQKLPLGEAAVAARKILESLE